MKRKVLLVTVLATIMLLASTMPAWALSKDTGWRSLGTFSYGSKDANLLQGRSYIYYATESPSTAVCQYQGWAKSTYPLKTIGVRSRITRHNSDDTYYSFGYCSWVYKYDTNFAATGLKNTSARKGDMFDQLRCDTQCYFYKDSSSLLTKSVVSSWL